MRAAPPVQLVCTGSLVWRAAHVLLPAVAAAAAVTWLLLHLQITAPRAGTWGLLAAAAAAAWFGLARPRWWSGFVRPATTSLVWDGQTWWVDGVRGRLEVMLHVGPWLLLLHHPDAASSPSRWLAVGRADAGAAHAAFCAAVYCRSSESTPAGSPRQP